MGIFEYTVIGILAVLAVVFVWHLFQPNLRALTWLWRFLFSACLLASMPVVFILMAFSNLHYGFLYGILYCIGAVLWLIFFVLKERGRLRLGIYILLLCLVLAAIGITAGVLEYKDYQFKKETSIFSEISEQAYLPYGGNAQTAKLNSTASLQLKEALPVIDGDIAFYPMYASFAQAVYPEGVYDSQTSVVRCSDTETAYQSLLSGKVNLIFVTKPSVQLEKSLKSQKINLKMTPIAKDGLVFFGHNSNPVSSLRTEDVKKIYALETVNWRDLGGKSQEIMAFQHPKNSGEQTVMEDFMNDISMAKPIMQMDNSDPKSYSGTVMEYINKKNAIGYGFRVQIQDMLKDDQLKLFSVNDIQPSRETTQNGTYPVLFDIYAVTADNPDENTQKLVDWILTEEGQKLVKDMGYVPVK